MTWELEIRPCIVSNPAVFATATDQLPVGVFLALWKSMDMMSVQKVGSSDCAAAKQWEIAV